MEKNDKNIRIKRIKQSTVKEILREIQNRIMTEIKA